MKTKKLLIVMLLIPIIFSFMSIAQSQDLLDYKGPCTGNLNVVKFTWHKDGFESVCFLDSITIKNNSSSRCKDLMCFADFYGSSGTRIGAVSFIIYDSIPPGKTKTFRNINVGLLPSPADQIRSASFQALSGIAK